MYGTVMIARSKAPLGTIRKATNAWIDDIGRDSGFVDERVLETADGRVVVCVRFRDEAAYKALADNPAQDVWWREKMAPLLDGDPEWIDGTWHDM